MQFVFLTNAKPNIYSLYFRSISKNCNGFDMVTLITINYFQLYRLCRVLLFRWELSNCKIKLIPNLFNSKLFKFRYTIHTMSHQQGQCKQLLLYALESLKRP